MTTSRFSSKDSDQTVRSAGEKRLDRWLAARMLRAMGNPPFRLRLWDGTSVQSAQPARFEVTFADRRALYQLALDPEYQFGELYTSGRLTLTGDLVEFIECAYRGNSATRGRGPGLVQRLLHRPRANSPSASRRNIHHHYNLANPFYELWLDRDYMQYTCAYFPDPAMTLEDAQAAKLHHVARKLCLEPGQTVVEAGCGWGGLGRFLARHYGVTVKAYNISHEQITYARERARQEGLEERVEYIEDDYRNIDGTCDRFVSVGMLEHVGTDNYGELGRIVDRCLREDGIGLIHSIGRNRPRPMNAWIEKRIFPGAYPPSLRQMMAIFEDNSLSVLDVENLRLHYAKTLEHWLARFEANVDAVAGMFDQEFVRTWRLYLAGSCAAFSTAQLQLFQVVFARANNNTIPLSREHLYPGGS
ncbi:MAG: cyclopropane-fatty-acyl-phospholipid synthase family protein [Halioglobus sp.]|nr:cyclopropane-fatty-acyl-phospholipid synthase family protein [Halioglobus sp.]